MSDIPIKNVLIAFAYDKEKKEFSLVQTEEYNIQSDESKKKILQTAEVMITMNIIELGGKK